MLVFFRGHGLEHLGRPRIVRAQTFRVGQIDATIVFLRRNGEGEDFLSERSANLRRAETPGIIE